MLHASATCNPAFHTTGSHYLNVDGTAFMQLLESRIFKDFPRLRLILTHGGGNVPYQAARYRALCLMNKWEPFEAVHQAALLRYDGLQRGRDGDAGEGRRRRQRILFASEMLGGVNAVDPKTGRMFDDNQPLPRRDRLADGRGPGEDLRAERRQAYPRLGPILDRRKPAAAVASGSRRRRIEPPGRCAMRARVASRPVQFDSARSAQSKVRTIAIHNRSDGGVSGVR